MSVTIMFLVPYIISFTATALVLGVAAIMQHQANKRGG